MNHPTVANPTILAHNSKKCFSAEGVKSGGCGKMVFHTQNAINQKLTTIK
jgi:hypothetical protein